MQILYEHRTPPRKRRKALLVIFGAALVVALLVNPPGTLWATWVLWAFATALLLLGTALLAISPIIFIWITAREIILDPYGPRRRIPLRHIHDIEAMGTGRKTVLTLHLRNGDSVDLTGRIGDPHEVHSLLTDLGVTTRQPGGTILSDSLAQRAGVDLLHGKAGKARVQNKGPEQEKDDIS
jgi:hypothetical protein